MSTAILNPAELATQATNRVPLLTTVRQTFALAWRGVLKMQRTPEQLFDVTAQPIIFTLLFTYVFGGAIAGDVQSYLPFFIPGILAQTVITTSIVTGIQLREDMDKGIFDRFRSLPIARIAPLSGALLADTVRYAIATSLTFAMGLLIGWRPGGGVPGVLAAGLLVIVCCWSMSWIFAFFGVTARSASSVQGISMIVIFPLCFASNAFVPADTLPGWLQSFVNVNPVSYLVSGVRALTIDGSWTADAGWALLGAAVVMAVFAPLTVRAYMRRA
ncbi:ABC transporter permease [Cellulomonas denverensis]|uniref:Transport permease protein n=1 Tax=Cellulomonas denverensis TaxID=264297 RepID=A0A7X6KSX7_9CELL|nr:ABC transporter permease [Cellulomonas denverensis]NKY21706.1 ABC transporter permease [Cellulomonas denverensis]GIG25636.1 transport permease protein [Cellulomonas denverensis]